MFRKGKKVWVAAALILVLLFTASPGGAARLGQGKPTVGWEGLWEWGLAWFGGGGATPSAGRVGHEKDSSQIDPLGQPTSLTECSGMIDPNGRCLTATTSTESDCSSGIDPNGRCHQ